MHSFSLRTSMEFIHVPNCSLLGINSLKSIFLGEKSYSYKCNHYIYIQFEYNQLADSLP